MDHAAQLRTMVDRLSRANQDLLCWDHIDAAGRAGVACVVERPALVRQALKLQLILLMADISRLQQEMAAATVYSTN